MNQNDMDRYFWRTGLRWSGDSRPTEGHRGRGKRASRTLFWLYAVLGVILALRLLVR